MQKTHFFPMMILVVVLILTACSPVQTPPTPPQSSATATLEAPTATLEIPTSAPTVEPTIPTAPTATEPAEPAHRFAGLAYTNAEGLWVVGRDGTPDLIIDQSQAVISPDGRYVAFVTSPPDGGQEDIGLLDRQTGETRNLTDTPDRNEFSPQFWAARPDVVLFESKPVSEELFGSGYPTLVQLDGSGYQVLDARTGGPIAPGPDGRTLAFGCCDAPGVLYYQETGSQSFFPESYGIPAEKMYLPAFSPDGNQLAWVVGGQAFGGGGWGLGVALFDLVDKTGRMLYTYAPQGGTEFVGDLVWSPDGQYLAYMNIGDPAGQGRAPTMHVLFPQSNDSVNLGIGHSPVWKPDGSELAFTVTPQDIQDQRIIISPTGNWFEMVEAPYAGESVGWIDVP